jgi:hypothetical protein
MPKRKLKPTLAEPGFAMRRKSIPYEFVLDAISELSPQTRPMFGCLAIYAGDKIVGVLRDKDSASVDNGMWLATTKEHHQSLQADFPNMRSIGVLGKGVTGWQILPAEAPDFEEAALRACEFILAGDPRIGKVPASKRVPRKPGTRKVRNKAREKS